RTPHGCTLFPYTTLFRSQRAQEQRAQDADRHVFLWVLRFLSRRRDGVEADVCEEHEARAAQHARPSIRAPVARIRRDEGVVMGRSEEHTSELQSPYDLVC